MPQLERIKILRSLDVLRGDMPLLPPFGVSVITAFLRRKGYDVTQDDLNARCFSEHVGGVAPIDRGRLLELLCDHDRVLRHLTGAPDAELSELAKRIVSAVDLAGYDAVLLSAFPTDAGSSIVTLLVAKHVKEHHRPLIVIGGEYNQFSPIGDTFETFHRAGIVDYYVSGPGEEALDRLFVALRTGGGLADVPGLIYADGGCIRRNPYVFGARSVVMPAFDGLPLPLYAWRSDATLARLAAKHLRITTDAAAALLDAGVTMLTFQSVTVCPNRCAFCCQSDMYPTRSGLLPPQAAVAQLRDLAKRYGTGNFFFLDDSINVSRRYMSDFCDEVLNADMRLLWSACARANHMDRELVRKMQAAGAVRLVIGLETASPRLLKFIDKGVSAGQVADLLRWAHEAGIVTSIEIIAGMPTETDADVAATIDFLRTHRADIDEAYLNPFYLERNSRMFKRPEDYGIANVASTRDFVVPLETVFEHPNMTFTFDEIGGLRWPEKRAQIKASYERIRAALGALGIRPAEDYGLSVLFALHGVMQDPHAIRRTYLEYAARRRRRSRLVLSSASLRRHLDEIRAHDTFRARAAAGVRKVLAGGRTLLERAAESSWLASWLNRHGAARRAAASPPGGSQGQR